MTKLSATDLAKMTAREVADLADLDFHAVRDEGFRRQALAEKKLAKAKKALEAAQNEMKAAEAIILAAFAEQRRAA
jgi:predicted metal-dependent hydrolase